LESNKIRGEGVEDEQGNTNEFVLKGDLTINRAGELQKQLLAATLLAATGQRKELIIDLQETGEIDLSFFQLLFATLKYCEKKGIQLGLKAHNSFWNYLQTIGFNKKTGFHSEGYGISLSLAAADGLVKSEAEPVGEVITWLTQA
jgi:anti-anti-sigma regulatory factor